MASRTAIQSSVLCQGKRSLPVVPFHAGFPLFGNHDRRTIYAGLEDKLIAALSDALDNILTLTILKPFSQERGKRLSDLNTTRPRVPFKEQAH